VSDAEAAGLAEDIGPFRRTADVDRICDRLFGGSINILVQA